MAETKNTFHELSHGGVLGIRRQQDVSGILASNKEARKNNQYSEFNRAFKKETGLVPIASIPTIVAEEWLTKTGYSLYDLNNTQSEKHIDCNKEFKKWLNDPVNIVWRTSNVRV